jgi:hypothetical protein
MANGLDRQDVGYAGRGGTVYRNEGGDGPDGWFYIIGSCAAEGPHHSAYAARRACMNELRRLDARECRSFRGPEARCEHCGGDGIEPCGISFDAGDGEGEDRPCSVCAA